MREILRKYDVAYGCFLFCGVAVLLISELSFIPMDDGTAGGLGFLVFIPLSLVALVAMAVGIGYTIRLYNHWPLVVLSLLSVLFIAEVVTEYGSAKLYNAVPILYGLSASGFSLAWFLILRKRWGKNV